MMNENEVILSTRLSPRLLIWGIVGFLVTGALAYNLLEGAINNIVTAIIFGIFALLALAFFLMVLCASKKFVLTHSYLIIKRPFLFLTHTVSLNNIKDIQKGDVKINHFNKGTTYNVYSGEKTIILLYNDRKIEINSLMVNQDDYHLLVFNLEKIKNKKQTKETFKTPEISENYRFLWILIICLIGSLIYAFFFNK